MLHSRRKRLGKIAEREAAGESLWAAAFDRPARVKLVHAFQDAAGDNYGVGAFYAAARDAVLGDEGLFFLCDKYMNEMEDLLNYVLRADDEIVPTVVEAMSRALHRDRLRQQITGISTPTLHGPTMCVMRPVEQVITTFAPPNRFLSAPAIVTWRP